VQSAPLRVAATSVNTRQSGCQKRISNSGHFRDDPKFRRDQVEKMGVGFELPAELKEEKPQRQNPANLWYAVLYRLPSESYSKR
jgi:hypothetical protein